ncbi:MAG TPA: gephyrin-like molybdotransferase Glp [Rhodocyclaceae bacterium]|nr:gephyrin-like molybdotransferase Glp [Rhodocyclaceae bacterium]
MTSILQAVSCLTDYDPDSLPVDTARRLTRELVEPVDGTERLFVRAALDRVLAEDVISPIDVPAHDNSAMDGYAVRAADLSPAGETRLTVAGTALAGQPWAGSLGPGECVRIMTGAVVPAGADTIVIQEAVRVEGREVVLPPGQKPGQNLRRTGEDLQAGRPALPAGKIVRPAELGLLASLGIAEVTVRRRVRVALFSTGDELVSIGTQPKQGEIFDSNRYTLYGMLTRLGCEVLDMGVVRDSPEALERALRAAARNADAIITSGGVSVGEADFIRGLMERLGEVLFWKIAMKPGRPMAFGRVGGAFLFGLPGNPVAVMVTFYQFVRDALLRMMGASPVEPVPSLRVPCVSGLKKSPGRTEFQRGILFREDDQWKVRVTGAQGSGVLRSMAQANCFIVLEHERGNVAPGDSVSVQIMEGLV